ncbi:hypothetical protein [Pontibacter ruber]|uniref:Uncharacterized protein n=1 Tax=Pontibacter ruber TaxID=1343895 RepID=A0ABW5CZK5_9BACT|nr:hypothetical protein [Pontibacter ruber]
MKKLYALLIVVLLAGYVNHVNAQSQGEIVVKRNAIGNAYFLNGQLLSRNELLYVLESNPEAKKELKIAYRNNAPATILSYAGGFLIGYPIGAQLGGGEPNWKVAGVGLGLMALSFPFTSAIRKHEHNAISIYNNGLKKTYKSKVDLQLGYAGNGAALKLVF